MATSALRDRVKAACLDFAWDEWSQMGILAASTRQSRWAQDPEALIIFTLEIARDDPRLFDELLDWLARNESIVSTRRLKGLCEGPDDDRLVGAALEWVAMQRRRPAPRHGRPPPNDRPERLFRGLTTPVRDPDPVFLAHGFLRPPASPSEKSGEPDVAQPINFAFRLRHLLGVSARAEAARYLLTVDAPHATVAAVASSAGYAKRNIQEALTSLQAAGAVASLRVGADQRFSVDRFSWAAVLGMDLDDVPFHREWPDLLAVLRALLRWLARPELDELSDYLRASQARDLLDVLRPRLASAGVLTAAYRGGEMAWDDLVETAEYLILALGPGAQRADRASFEIYRDAHGQYRWRLKAPNGRVLAASADSYASASTGRGAAARWRERSTASKYTIDIDEVGNFRWRASSRNGQPLAVSAEAFATQEDAEHAARLAQDIVSSTAAP